MLPPIEGKHRTTTGEVSIFCHSFREGKTNKGTKEKERDKKNWGNRGVGRVSVVSPASKVGGVRCGCCGAVAVRGFPGKKRENQGREEGRGYKRKREASSLASHRIHS